MKAQQKKPYFVSAIIILALVVVCGYVVIRVLPRIAGMTQIPPDQIIREQENICVLFTVNSGAEEEAMVATAYCHTLQKPLTEYIRGTGIICAFLNPSFAPLAS